MAQYMLLCIGPLGYLLKYHAIIFIKNYRYHVNGLHFLFFYNLEAYKLGMLFSERWAENG